MREGVWLRGVMHFWAGVGRACGARRRRLRADAALYLNVPITRLDVPFGTDFPSRYIADNMTMAWHLQR